MNSTRSIAVGVIETDFYLMNSLKGNCVHCLMINDILNPNN